MFNAIDRLSKFSLDFWFLLPIFTSGFSKPISFSSSQRKRHSNTPYIPVILKYVLLRLLRYFI